MSPRRSSRAKTVAHHSVSNHHSSSSSASSARGTSTRPQRGKDASPINDTFHTYSRGSRASSHARTNGAIVHDDIASGDEEEDEPEDEDEEEVTRCICGFAEYQGEDGTDATSDGFFIQCDKCHVWQHGYCVGIMGSEFAPDNYFCEKCKPDLHRLVIRAHGPKSSVYLPVHGEDSPADSHHSTKRRSTMNSRDAAYDEEAILARVLEESKTEAKVPGTGRQRRKRAGSGTPDDSKDSKRRRTSESEESGPQGNSSGSGDEASNSGATVRKARNNSVKNADKNNSKRTARNTTKGEKGKDSKKEDSDHSDDSVEAIVSTEKPAKLEHIPIPIPTITETPAVVTTTSITTTTTSTAAGAATTTTTVMSKEEPTVLPPTPAKEKQQDTPQKRRTNANAGRRNRKAHNRFSEDPNSDNPSSHQMARDDSVHGHHGHGKSSDKPSKPRIPQPKMTMKEMVKRVKQISTYISQTQIEMAAKATTLPTPLTGRTDSSSSTTTQSSVDAEKEEIRSTEMMDALTRKIVRWQKTYG